MNACHNALALLREGKTDEAHQLLEDVCKRPEDADYYEALAKAQGHDELEFDDGVCFSPGEPDGCWITSWTWIYRVDVNDAKEGLEDS